MKKIYAAACVVVCCMGNPAGASCLDYGDVHSSGYVNCVQREREILRQEHRLQEIEARQQQIRNDNWNSRW